MLPGHSLHPLGGSIGLRAAARLTTIGRATARARPLPERLARRHKSGHVRHRAGSTAAAHGAR